MIFAYVLYNPNSESLMLNILELPVSKFNKLTSLEPTIDKDWKTDLMDIVLSLDKDSQQSIYHDVIRPKGIIYDPKSKQLIKIPRPSLAETLKTAHASDLLASASTSLLDLMTPPPTI